MSVKLSQGSGAYCRARADECRTDADAAVLENVRQRCLRAQAAWLQMADRNDQRELNRENAENARRALQIEMLGTAPE